MLVPLVMSWKVARVFVEQSHQFAADSAVLSAASPIAARPWSAIARSADHCGAPTLVPPTSTQP